MIRKASYLFINFESPTLIKHKCVCIILLLSDRMTSSKLDEFYYSSNSHITRRSERSGLGIGCPEENLFMWLLRDYTDLITYNQSLYHNFQKTIGTVDARIEWKPKLK